MEAWKIIFLSKWLISRFHVNLPGCKFSEDMMDPFLFPFSDKKLRKICPKIEKPQALTNIEGIIEKSQALMVARPRLDASCDGFFSSELTSTHGRFGGRFF